MIFKLHKLVARFSRKNIGFYSSVASIAWLNIILRLSAICISYQHNSAIIDSLIPKPPFATPSLNRTKSGGFQLPTQWDLDQVKVASWLLFFCCVLAVGNKKTSIPVSLNNLNNLQIVKCVTCHWIFKCW